jgi:hypothetical protein
MRSPAEEVTAKLGKDTRKMRRRRGGSNQEETSNQREEDHRGRPIDGQRPRADGANDEGPQNPGANEGPSSPEFGGDGVEPQEMSIGEIQSAVHKMIKDAVEYVDQELSPARAVMAQYYKGEPFGNEEEGRSQFVMTVLRDTVLMVLPSLMRVFFGANDALEYFPRRMDQLEKAEQLTRFVSDIVIKQDNRGFLVFYEWFKDALIKSLGIVKYYWDERTSYKDGFAYMLTEDEMAALLQSDDVEVTAVSQSEISGKLGEPRWDVEYTEKIDEGRIRVIALPPEEYIFTRGARTTAGDAGQPGVALIAAHRTELTRSQLREMGVSEEDIAEYGFKDVTMDHNQEEIQRQHIVKPDTSAIGPVPTQKALYIESYPFMDIDGDGIAELVKVTMLGPGYHVIGEPEKVSHRPFAVLCPDPEPHTIIGQGFADYTMDLQKIMSMVIRSLNDSLSLAIHPRMGYIENDANLADIMNTEIGAPIRMRSQGAVFPIEQPFVGAQAMPVLDMYKEVLRNRTGISPDAQGLDSDTMQSTTKAAVAATVAASQQHIELIARIFAETGVKDLFRGILHLMAEHPQKPRVGRMLGQYVEITPDAQGIDLDVGVNVAIGAGLDEEKYQVLAEAAADMMQLFQLFGMSQPLVGPAEYRRIRVEMLKLRGRTDAELFYKKVDPNWAPPPQQPNEPAMVAAQAQAEKSKAEIAQGEKRLALAAQKHQHDQSMREAELQLKQREQDMVDARERERIAMDGNIALHNTNTQAKVNVHANTLAQHVQNIKNKRDAHAKVQIAREQPKEPAGGE